MTQLPPIPQNSEFFKELVWGAPAKGTNYPNREGEHDCWLFELRFDGKRRAVIVESCTGLGESDMRDIQQFRPIIAAVAAAEWWKEVVRLESLAKAVSMAYPDDCVSVSELGRLFDKAHADCRYYEAMARQHAKSWMAWGNWT